MTDPCCTIFKDKRLKWFLRRHADVPPAVEKLEKSVQNTGWIIGGQKRLLWDTCPTNKYLWYEPENWNCYDFPFSEKNKCRYSTFVFPWIFLCSLMYITPKKAPHTYNLIYLFIELLLMFSIRISICKGTSIFFKLVICWLCTFLLSGSIINYSYKYYMLTESL